MAPIQFKLLKSTNSLIFLLISLLGFSTSCKQLEPRVEYGTPHADFLIRGIIESATDSKQIPDIIVEMRKEIKSGYGQSDIRLIGTGFSNINGDYKLNDVTFPFPGDQSYQIKFLDTDGALNGEFETLDTTIVFKDPQYINGDGHWYSGSVEKEVNIKLKPKK
jgi:putative lipoprotein (rSAM/lipoprotein system)